MYKTIVLVFVCLLCFLTSCRAIRQESQKNTSTSESYFQQKETFRDTVLFAPKSETSLKIPVSELVFKQGLNDILKPKILTQKNGNATAKISIIKDTVTVTATCDSLAIVAKIKKELQREIKATARSNVETSTKSSYSLLDVLRAFVIGVLLGAAITFTLKTLKII